MKIWSTSQSIKEYIRNWEEFTWNIKEEELLRTNLLPSLPFASTYQSDLSCETAEVSLSRGPVVPVYEWRLVFELYSL